MNKGMRPLSNTLGDRIMNKKLSQYPTTPHLSDHSHGWLFQFSQLVRLEILFKPKQFG